MAPEATSRSSLAQLPFEAFAGLAAIAVGLGGLAYSIAFLVLLYSGAPKAADVLTNVFLLAGGVLGTAVFVALYERFRPAEPGFALWAFLLGSLGAIGSAAHGGYDLANIVKTPTSLDKDLPSATDPRGFATFGLTRARDRARLAARPARRPPPAPARLPRPDRVRAAPRRLLRTADHLQPEEPRAADGRAPHRLRRQPGLVRVGRARALARPVSRRSLISVAATAANSGRWWFRAHSAGQRRATYSDDGGPQ